MTRDDLIARLLEVRAESQRSVDTCRSFEQLGVGGTAANDRLMRRFLRHVEALDAAIDALRPAAPACDHLPPETGWVHPEAKR